MQMRKLAFNPPSGAVALTTTLTTNIFNCNVTSLAGPVGFTLTQPYALIYAIYLVNKTASNATASLWKGATGANTAGTEFLVTATTVLANSMLPFYNPQGWRFDSADFLVGGSNTATTITLMLSGEIGISG